MNVYRSPDPIPKEECLVGSVCYRVDWHEEGLKVIVKGDWSAANLFLLRSPSKPHVCSDAYSCFDQWQRPWVSDLARDFFLLSNWRHKLYSVFIELAAFFAIYTHARKDVLQALRKKYPTRRSHLPLITACYAVGEPRLCLELFPESSKLVLELVFSFSNILPSYSLEPSPSFKSSNLPTLSSLLAWAYSGPFPSTVDFSTL